VSRAVKYARDFIEIRYHVPEDRTIAARLIERFELADAIVVETGGGEQETTIIGQEAASYFMTRVSDNDSVAFSCGETLLRMIEALPRRPTCRLRISQLSAEGEPESIHQSPATLVGLLRSKVSPESTSYGVQLPPAGLLRNNLDIEFRHALRTSKQIASLAQQAKTADYVFIGVGALFSKSTSGSHDYVRVANLATKNRFAKAVADLRLVGEINNRVYDDRGVDRTESIPELGERFLNFVTLDDLRGIVKRGRRVVIVATGVHKADAIRVALESKIANVVITGRDTAQRLLAR